TGPDISGGAASYFSLIDITSNAVITGTNNKLNVDPLLSPLGNYGGPTQTHVLMTADSPAYDPGSNPANLNYDERRPGVPRVNHGGEDIGATELANVIPSAKASSPNVLAFGGTSQSIAVTYSDELGIDVSTLGTGDISVTGPGGFKATPLFQGVDLNTNGTP